MKIIANYLIIIFLCCISSISYSQNKAHLVAVGGGNPDSSLLSKIVHLSKVKDPVLLLIPYASEPNTINATVKNNANMFKRIGVRNINHLDISDLKTAKELIENSDIIWMSGGDQVRLRKALEQAGLIEAILKRYNKGNVVICGNSAGASVMNNIMMAGSEKDEATGELKPILSYGLNLWAKSIIDQHFTQWKRISRLRTAVKNNPTLLGIGIDERTGVVYDKSEKIAVLGKGTVTFLKSDSAGEIKETILKAGEIYRY